MKKILVFEYITGGGFNKQELPESLLAEGLLMLNALLANLAGMTGIEVTVMLDCRLAWVKADHIADIKPTDDVVHCFVELLQQADLVWPVAPECDGILQHLCQLVADSGKILLCTSADAVAIAANKLKTYRRLSLQSSIVAVPTWLLHSRFPFHRFQNDSEWVVKPVDGVGGEESYLISNMQELVSLANNNGRIVVQPHLYGKKTSLSCIFKEGKGWLICANLQNFALINQQYRLVAIVVNSHTDDRYQLLVDRIARAMPGLWGYAGIDLIENDKLWVLEVNPRLTTSFVGIHQALGINIADSVLQLLDSEPSWQLTKMSRAVTVIVNESLYIENSVGI